MKWKVWSVSLLAVASLPCYSKGFSLSSVVSQLFGSSGKEQQRAAAGRPAWKNKPMVEHAPGVVVADYASDEWVPKIRVGGRVNDLMHGWHFDSLLQDTPDEIRPPSVIVFYDSSNNACMDAYDGLKWDEIAQDKLPARERLLTARYDVYAAPRRLWFKFTPEMDLEKRFKVSACPEVVYVPRSCDGWTKWCSNGPDSDDPDLEVMGCEDFVESCPNTVQWDGKGDLVQWIMHHVDADGEPRISKFLGTYQEQGRWLQVREGTTTNTHMRNAYLTQAFPAFTKSGFKAMKVPEEFMSWLKDFMKRNENKKRTENWPAESTQVSFHETPTDFIDLDMVMAEKNRMANKYVKPLVEEWSRSENLELTAFYGVRFYNEGSFLRGHVDRIDSHVLSVTITAEKGKSNKPWPLQVVDWKGQIVRYEHPEGYMVLYESSKLVHGRDWPLEGGEGANPDDVFHAGAFVHFKPKLTTGADAAKWEEIASKARSNQNVWTKRIPYHTTRTVEPRNPVFAEKNYGDKSKWRHMDKTGKLEREVRSDSFSVTFKNEADRTLDVYWDNPTGSPILQGTLGPSANFVVETFQNHRFFFADQDTTNPIPGGQFTMERGRSVVKYDLTREGNKRPPSKWASFVKDKLKQESQL